MRPSTLTESVVRSALEPSSVTVLPLTDTRPATISSSALRRLEIPACARIFWRRSSGIGLLGGRLGGGVFRALPLGGRGRLLGGRSVFFGVGQSEAAELFCFFERG